MNSTMKPTKFNFFQSPHPNPIDFNRHRQPCLEQPDEHDSQEQYLFRNSLHQGDHQSNLYPESTSRHPKKEQHNHDLDDMDASFVEEIFPEDDQSLPAIANKISIFDQEQMYEPMTPKKQQGGFHEDEEVTARKISHYIQPQPDIKMYQRGLKKLAHEAFKFVSHQKKTTYKEVARKLITQLTINDNEIQKRGEMNIKRRIYDALNVLIALGLLKRIGNKIIIKKSQHEYSHDKINDQVLIKNKEQIQQNLLEQSHFLKKQLKNRQQALKQKQSVINNLQKKIKSLQKLTQRNKTNDKINRDNTLHFPLMSVLYSQKTMKVNEISMNQTIQNNNIQLWQDGSRTMVKNIGPTNLQFMGDFDLIFFLTQSLNNKPKEQIIPIEHHGSRKRNYK